MTYYLRCCVEILEHTLMILWTEHLHPRRQRESANQILVNLKDRKHLFAGFWLADDGLPGDVSPGIEINNVTGFLSRFTWTRRVRRVCSNASARSWLTRRHTLTFCRCCNTLFYCPVRQIPLFHHNSDSIPGVLRSNLHPNPDANFGCIRPSWDSASEDSRKIPFLLTCCRRSFGGVDSHCRLEILTEIPMSDLIIILFWIVMQLITDRIRTIGSCSTGSFNSWCSRAKPTMTSTSNRSRSTSKRSSNCNANSLIYINLNLIASHRLGWLRSVSLTSNQFSSWSIQFKLNSKISFNSDQM